MCIRDSGDESKKEADDQAGKNVRPVSLLDCPQVAPHMPDEHLCPLRSPLVRDLSAPHLNGETLDNVGRLSSCLNLIKLDAIADSLGRQDVVEVALGLKIAINLPALRFYLRDANADMLGMVSPNVGQALVEEIVGRLGPIDSDLAQVLPCQKDVLLTHSQGPG